MKKLLYLLCLIPCLARADTKLSALTVSTFTAPTDLIYKVQLGNPNTSQAISIGNFMATLSTAIATTSSSTASAFYGDGSHLTGVNGSPFSSAASTTTLSFPFQANFSTITVSTSPTVSGSPAGQVFTVSQIKRGTVYDTVFYVNSFKNGGPKGNFVIQTSSTGVYDPNLQQTTITLVPSGGINTGAIYFSLNGNNNDIVMSSNGVAFYDAAGSGYTQLASSASIVSPVTFVLPQADGSAGNPVATDGHGNLSLSNSVTVATAAVTNFTINGSNGNAGQYVGSNGAGNAASWYNRTLPPISGTFDGGGSLITVPSTFTYVCPYAMTIDTWTIVCATGSVTVDVRRMAYSVYTTSTTSIVGAGTMPSVTANTHNTAAPSSWTSTALNYQDVLEFIVTAATTTQKAYITLFGH